MNRRSQLEHEVSLAQKTYQRSSQRYAGKHQKNLGTRVS